MIERLKTSTSNEYTQKRYSDLDARTYLDSRYIKGKDGGPLTKSWK